MIKTRKSEFAERPVVDAITSEKERKINLKIQKEDLVIIDRLCKKHDVSRTTLLNELLEMVFLAQIKQIGDVRLETLLLHRADKKVNWRDAGAPWTVCYHASRIFRMIENLTESGSEDGSPNTDVFSQDKIDRYEAVGQFFKNLDADKKGEEK